MRDLDGTPSPFPVPIIFAFVCPCLARRFAVARPFVQRQQHEVRRGPEICVAACACHPTKSATPEAELSVENLALPRAANLPHHLIRVPNAAERRASIVVTFDSA